MKCNRLYGLASGAFLALAATAAPARAEEPAPAATLPAAAAPAAGRDDFAKGTRTLSLYGSYIHDYQHDGDLGFGAVGVSEYVLDRFALGAEVRGFGISQDGPDAVAVAGDLFLRHHLIVADPWSLYLDGAVGVFYADHDTPAGGTQFNFIEEAGVGATYRVDDGVYLIGGVRYFHLSNARIDGPDRNPAMNGLEGYFGVMFTF